MPLYIFKGRNERTGAVVNGNREAISHTALGQDLLREGILLTSFVERKSGLKTSTFSLFSKVPMLERVLFARYFALMLKAGLDVKSALATLQRQTKNKPFSEAIQSVYQGIERGQTLASSMRAFPNAFSALFISFIQVGEATGKLQETLEILAKQLQKDFELRRAVRGGMLYPLVIVGALVIVGIAMMIFVIPKLVEIFQGFNVELPFTTKALIAISSFATTYWYVVVLAVIVILVVGRFLLKVPSVRLFVMDILLRVPVIGSITKDVNIARFSRNLSSLLSSGVAFGEALAILGDNTPSPVYARVFTQAEAHVKEGRPLSEFFERQKHLFPAIVISIMSVGEQTGELDNVLNEIALFYEGEVDQTMKNLTSVLEPILMIIIGLAVGALAISVISPIYSLVNVI